MLLHRRKRWSNIVPSLDQRLAFAVLGVFPTLDPSICCYLHSRDWYDKCKMTTNWNCEIASIIVESVSMSIVFMVVVVTNCKETVYVVLVMKYVNYNDYEWM